ncbi:MAG: D-alanine--D-alanine ligase family protein [Actinomycetota bacterium]
MTSGSDDRIRLVVLFGGQSAEHDVSCTTAAHVLAAVDKSRYLVETIGITRDGRFVQAGNAEELLAGGARSLPEAGGDPTTDDATTDADGGGGPAALVPVGPETELLSTVGDGAGGHEVVVLPLLHGPLGEDGTVQGLCELANVAYVGAGVLGSAAAMDKVMAKTILDSHRIPQTNWRAVHEREVTTDAAAVAKRLVADLGLPCFIKPANMGSSVGVAKASTAEEVVSAMEAALTYDEWLVVEEAVVAREIEVAVLGNDNLEMSVPGEIIPGAEFYDYEDKYVDGNAQLVIPAELAPTEVERIHELAGDAYRALRVEGMARADFLYEEGGRGPLVNELNTIPGFTPISMYPKLWEASGLGYSDLIDRLVDLARDRHRRRSAKRITSRNTCER